MNFKLVISSEPKLHGWRKYAYKLGVLDDWRQDIDPRLDARLESWKEGDVYPLVHAFLMSPRALYACGTYAVGGGTNVGAFAMKDLSFEIKYKQENTPTMPISENFGIQQRPVVFSIYSTPTTLQIYGYWNGEEKPNNKGAHRLEKRGNYYFLDGETINYVSTPDYMNRTNEIWIGGDPSFRFPLIVGKPFKINLVVLSSGGIYKILIPYKDENGVICWLDYHNDELYYSNTELTYSIE